jgi:hypothetical protein
MEMRRSNYHLCDGGYSDNAGLVGTIRLIEDLVDEYRAEYKKNGSKPPFERILFLSIESFPDNVVETENDAAGLSSGILGPLSAIFASRVASQAERAELELELLIRSENESYSRRTDSQLMAVFDLQKYEDYRSKAERIVSRIKSSNLNEDRVDELVGLISPISKTQVTPAKSTSNDSVVSITQMKGIRSKAEEFLKHSDQLQESVSVAFGSDEQSLLSDFIEQAKAMATLVIPDQSSAPVPASSPFELSIAGIQFRFDPGLHKAKNMAGVKSAAIGKELEEESKGEKAARDKKVPDPPLSWMLSPYDKARMEVAWVNQLARIREQPAESASSASAIPSTPSIENMNLTSPKSLKKMFGTDKKTKQP